MLNFPELQRQFIEFGTYRIQEEQRQKRRLRRALEALYACSPVWETLRDRTIGRRFPFLVAGLRARPDDVASASLRPTPMTVVATDGSQIYPERDIDPPCYLLNISRIAFQYGTLEAPVMDAQAQLRFRRHDLEDILENKTESITASIVSAIRDEEELRLLYETASASRFDTRPLVSIIDGTLIRWMLSGLNNSALETDLIDRYVALLDLFAAEELPICSYISRPGNTEVVNLLRVFEGDIPTSDSPTDPGASLAGLMDWQLFERLLEPGQRSCLFESGSMIQKSYGEASRICYFYLCVPTPASSEIARVEVPRWIADRPDLIDLIHGTLLDQTEKGRGYPIILSEAHEHAVIRSSDRDLFYLLLGNYLRQAGLPSYSESYKRISKQRPMV